MSQDRSAPETKEPHVVTLKVLRLSRPTLAEQHVLPADNPADPSLACATGYSQAYPENNDPFILTPLLTLPPAFGSVFIGETFSCILSASSSSTLPITGLTISASMQTPSQTLELPLATEPAELNPSDTLQRIVTYDLREEGPHVLAVTVSYTHADVARTFRKLYQFGAQHCIVVRTKTGLLEGSAKGKGKALLEAQLENMSEGSVVLEEVGVATRGGWSARGLNSEEEVVLRSRDVVQVAFLMERDQVFDGTEREVLGCLTVGWRGGGGGRGVLRTGKLAVAG